MGIKSLGNANVKYKAVWKQTGLEAADRIMIWYGDRGIWGGGAAGNGSPIDNIGYRSLATTGNASDFGDLSQARGWLAAESGT